MPLTAAFRTKLNDWLQSRAMEIAGKQANYLAAQGRYWQGLFTPILVPADELELPVDPTRKATDHPSWAAAAIALPVTAPCQLWCDSYDGPQGVGYVLGVRVVWQGRTYERRRNVGPETWRTHDWQDVTFPA